MSNLGRQFVTVKHDNEERIVHTRADGKIKYYTTYGSAWDAANRLNDKGHKPKGVDYEGSWMFEGHVPPPEHNPKNLATGWYLFYDRN
jgi:hypothetical protein